MPLPAKVRARCQIITNALPAGPLKIQRPFYVVEDENAEHMIFCIDQSSRLCLVMKVETGKNELIDLHTTLGLGDGRPVTALAVSQNRDLTVNVVFAVRGMQDTDRLYMLASLAPTRENWTSGGTLKQAQYNGEQSAIRIRSIMLGTNNDSADQRYPMAYLTFAYADSKTEDICALDVNMDTGTWRNRKIIEMPCNPREVISMCPGNCAGLRGLLVLWREVKESDHPLQMRFVSYNPTVRTPTIRESRHLVPPGAAHITSFENKEGQTDFLISGDGLYHLTAGDCRRGAPDGGLATLVDGDKAHSNLEQFFTAQSEDVLSVWSLSKSKLISYQEYAVPKEGDKLTAITPLIPLLDQKTSTSFSALQHPRLGQKLFVLDDTGHHLQMLEQDVHTATWGQPIDILIPDSDQIVEFQSHTLLLQVHRPGKGPVIAQKLKLVSSVAAELIVNGKTIRASGEGTEVETDTAGRLTIIIMTSGLSTPLLTLHNPTAEEQVFKHPVEIDPMTPLWKQLDKINSPQELRNLKLKDGKPFLKPTLSDGEVKNAFEGLQTMKTARRELQERKRPPQSVASRVWGAWKWVSAQMDAAAKWFFELVDGVWQFVVEIAGKLWRFVLENYPQIAAAAELLLGCLAESGEWLMGLLGSALGWEEILKTKNLLVNFATAGMLWGIGMIGDLEDKVDTFFEQKKKDVRALRDTAFPKELQERLFKDEQQSDDQVDEVQWEEDKENGPDTPAANFGMYHLNNAGSISSQALDDDPAERIFMRFADLFEEFGHLVSRLMGNIGDALNDRNMTFEDILIKIGWQLLEDMVEVMQKTATTLIGSVGDLLLILADSMNQKITVPVLSPIYKRLTNNDLTILDLTCLLIAIPTTLSWKQLTGKPPSALQGAGDWIEADKLRPMLDARMGRIREEMNQTINADDEMQATQSVITLFSMPLQGLPSKALSRNADTDADDTGPVAIKALSSTASLSEKSTIAASVQGMEIPIPVKNYAVKRTPTALTKNTTTDRPAQGNRQKAESNRNRTSANPLPKDSSFKEDWPRLFRIYTICKGMLSMATVILKHEWYWIKTYPTMLGVMPLDGSWSWFDSVLKWGKIILYIGECVALGMDCPKAIRDKAKDFYDLYNYKYVNLRVPILLIGGVKVFIQSFMMFDWTKRTTTSFTKTPEYLLNVVVSTVQLGVMLDAQGACWRQSGSSGYPVTIAIEEWIISCSCIANGIMGLTQGGDKPYYITAATAAALQSAAAGYAGIRTYADLTETDQARSTCVSLDC